METYESAGLQIAYLDARPAGGSRLPIVLVHGFASSHMVNWVNPLWVETLTGAGRRVLAPDNRGHGRSDKPHDPASYHVSLMAADVLRLLDHAGIERADVMGYSMGARITAYLALAHPGRVRSIVLGGLGHHLLDGHGLPTAIADAMEAPDPETLTDPTQRLFRRFADANGGDRVALAACIRGSRQVLAPDEVRRIACPALVAVGTKDLVAGDAARLAALLPNGRALDIPDRDHNRAVGDKVYKRGVQAFLAALDEPPPGATA